MLHTCTCKIIHVHVYKICFFIVINSTYSIHNVYVYKNTYVCIICIFMHIYAYIFHTNMKCLMVYGTVHVGLKIVFSQRSAVALRVRVLRRGTQCFMVSNICVSGTILTCLMVRFWSEVTPSGAIFSGWITCSRTSIEMKSKHEKKAYISMNCD